MSVEPVVSERLAEYAEESRQDPAGFAVDAAKCDAVCKLSKQLLLSKAAITLPIDESFVNALRCVRNLGCTQAGSDCLLRHRLMNACACFLNDYMRLLQSGRGKPSDPLLSQQEQLPALLGLQAFNNASQCCQEIADFNLSGLQGVLGDVLRFPCWHNAKPIDVALHNLHSLTSNAGDRRPIEALKLSSGIPFALAFAASVVADDDDLRGDVSLLCDLLVRKALEQQLFKDLLARVIQWQQHRAEADEPEISDLRDFGMLMKLLRSLVSNSWGQLDILDVFGAVIDQDNHDGAAETSGLNAVLRISDLSRLFAILVDWCVNIQEQTPSAEQLVVCMAETLGLLGDILGVDSAPFMGHCRAECVKTGGLQAACKLLAILPSDVGKKLQQAVRQAEHEMRSEEEHLPASSEVEGKPGHLFLLEKLHNEAKDLKGESLECSFVYGLKRDALRVVANASYGCIQAQQRVLDVGGVHAVLNHCGVDGLNPYQQEWAVVCVRNLCALPAIQDEIAKLQAQEVSATPTDLKAAGVSVSLKDGKLAYSKDGVIADSPGEAAQKPSGGLDGMQAVIEECEDDDSQV